MNSFPQLPGEPADAFEQLLLHRDFGPSRQFSQTADVVGCSESTLRRRADQWNWVERLADYDSGMLQQASEARTKEDLERYKHQLETFRQEQLARARTVGDRADELLAMVERSVRHHLEAGTVLQGRELPSVMAAACKALEGAMNIEATALGFDDAFTNSDPERIHNVKQMLGTAADKGLQVILLTCHPEAYGGFAE